MNTDDKALKVINEHITVRKMAQDEVELAVEWAAKEGWNPGLYDSVCFYNTDPCGFFIQLYDNDPMCIASAVRYEDLFAFFGFYISAPKYRGRIVNFKGLYETVFKYIEDVENVGCDGVLSKTKKYEKLLGFKYAHKNGRYESMSRKYDVKENIIDIKQYNFERLLEYDRGHFPAPRPQFLREWVKQPHSSALGIEDNGKLAGYGVIRTCRKGYKIGPLFANNYDIAESLYLALVSSVDENEPVFLDVPEINEDAQKLAKKYNMSVVFETARMYTKGIPDIKNNEVYGITTFELG